MSVTRLYRVVVTDDKTGSKDYLSDPMPYHEAITMLSKFFPAPANRPKPSRYHIEEV